MSPSRKTNLEGPSSVKDLVDGGGVCSGFHAMLRSPSKASPIKETSSFHLSSDEGVSGVTIADGATSFWILGSQTRRYSMQFPMTVENVWVTYSFCSESSRSHDVILKSRPSFSLDLLS
jgi:hypothetical protein